MIVVYIMIYKAKVLYFLLLCKFVSFKFRQISIKCPCDVYEIAIIGFYLHDGVHCFV